MSKRKTGKVPRAQTVSENDSYYAPVSLVQTEQGKVAKICPFDASAFLGLLDDDDSDKIADDEEDNVGGMLVMWSFAPGQLRRTRIVPLNAPCGGATVTVVLPPVTLAVEQSVGRRP
ncbi:unnamed protein product [Cylindrotheca closterium]|uniref:Uncharacterized protein n=1 Tax=Cylindrotheca closterium TaxID=2856 RepID=A0AAD2CCK5_9STRA|nr:unnamed protein product [Cylindrotheca closterium]